MALTAEEFAERYPNLNTVYLLTHERVAPKYKPITARAIMAWMLSTMNAVKSLPFDQWDESLRSEVAEKALGEWHQAMSDLKMAPTLP